MDRLECDRMLVAVLEAGSFSRAAERLGISAAKASKLISRLESELGVQLITRTTRALSPTDIGEFYYERARAVLEQIDELDSAVQHSSGRPSGRLRLTAPIAYGILKLMPVLNDFARAYPDIQLDVDFSDRLAHLVDEGFDAALRIGVPADNRLVARRLTTTSTVVIAAPSYLKRRGEPTAPAQLASHDCIIDTNPVEPNSWRFVDNGNEITVNVTGKLRFSSAEASLSAAEKGLGITRIPEFVAERALHYGTVRELLPGYRKPASLGVHVVFPSNRHLTARVRVLIDFLVEHLGDTSAAARR